MGKKYLARYRNHSLHLALHSALVNAWPDAAQAVAATQVHRIPRAFHCSAPHLMSRKRHACLPLTFNRSFPYLTFQTLGAKQVLDFFVGGQMLLQRRQGDRHVCLAQKRWSKRFLSSAADLIGSCESARALGTVEERSASWRS